MNYDKLSPAELKKEKLRLQSLYEFKVLNKQQEEIFNTVLNLLSGISKKPIVCVSLIYNKSNYYRNELDPKTNITPFLKFGHLFPKEKDIIIADTSLDSRCSKSDLVKGKEHIRFFARFIIRTKSSVELGQLCIFDDKPGKLSVKQAEELKDLASLIVSLIETSEQKNQLELLNSGLLNALQLQLKEQNKVLNLFSRFVPPLIVKRHLKSNDINFNDAEVKNLTVLFCDIRGYTNLVEHLHPSEAVAILKLYYEHMSDIINSFGGMVNQYVGDEIFATFGDPFTKPPYELNAVYCALKMMDEMKSVNISSSKLISEEIKVGIGIHCGQVITGTLGSREKIEYSVTGDTVNTGKRIESYTQADPGTILISDAVYEKVKDHVKVIQKEQIIVKGKSVPIKVYQLISKI